MRERLLKILTNDQWRLLFIGLFCWLASILSNQIYHYTFSDNNLQHNIQQSLKQKEQQFNHTLEDTAFIKQCWSSNSSGYPSILDNNASFGLFILDTVNDKKSNIQYWNSNHFSLNPTEIYKADGSYLVHYTNGYFELIKRTLTQDNEHKIIIGLLPIKWDYFINNKYLKSTVEGIDNAQFNLEINNKKGLELKGASNNTLCYFELIQNSKHLGYNWISVVLRLIGLFFLLILLHQYASTIAINNKLKGITFLVVAVGLLRWVSYIAPFPFYYSSFTLFDPAVYASSSLHPSLGHLLVNSILLYWVVIFCTIHIDGLKWNNLPKPLLAVISFVYYILLTLSLIFVTKTIISLIKDAQISYDVTNFFSLSIYSIIGWVIATLLTLTLFYLAQWSTVFHSYSVKRYLLNSGIIIVTGFIIKIFSHYDNYVLITIWLLVVTFLIQRSRVPIKSSFIHTKYFIGWTLFFAFSCAILMLYEQQQVELAQRKKLAERLVLQSDPCGESLLNIATTNFTDNFLTANFNRLKNDLSNKHLKDSLISENFSGYLNKYDTRIYTFDASFQSLHNDDSTTYTALKQSISSFGRQTSIEGLYSNPNKVGQLSFIYQKVIKDSDQNIIGYLFVSAKAKQYKSEALYPELFTQVNDIATDLNTNYAYGIYSFGKLINHFNAYNFPQFIPNEIGKVVNYKTVFSKGYEELWYNAEDGNQVIIAKKNDWMLGAITLFAYLFFTFLVITLLLHFIEKIASNSFPFKNGFSGIKLTIKSQIHLTIIATSVVSFIIIGVATISFFIIRVNDTNEQRLIKSIQIVSSEIENEIKYKMAFDDAITPNDIYQLGIIEKKINEIAENHSVDVNFFDRNGKLVFSTQPYIYNKQLLSEQIEPKAFESIKYAQAEQVIQKESIGLLNYLSIYVPIKDEAGNTTAILNIPYLNTQSEINKEVSGYLATLMNLNAFIFLIAGALSFLVANKITASFDLIGEKMRNMKLGGNNEKIIWNSEDEIGILVNEYNRMVQQLEASALALTKSEREGAWREMAKQVAHEIKNPLTPMKLSIQYLQKEIDAGNSNVKELSKNVAETLIEQINQLNKIAGDFAQFANITETNETVFNLNTLLNSLVGLYQYDDSITITWQPDIETCMLKADNNQMKRLFTNLIKNAIEAAEKGDNPMVTITQQSSSTTTLIAIKDNGNGIPTAIQKNIFTPNFTTKTSGTGLGLAISKNIVLNAKGKIWFETNAEVGTTFYVQLPLFV